MTVEVECVKRDTWISIGECDCNLFMQGWYHSTIRSKAMEEYEKEYKRQVNEPFPHLSGESTK